MAHTLPALPYAHDALEPHIDAQTMEIHHGKHHQGYVNNLNAALEGLGDLADMDVHELLQQSRPGPRRQAASCHQQRRWACESFTLLVYYESKRW